MRATSNQPAQKKGGPPGPPLTRPNKPSPIQGTARPSVMKTQTNVLPYHHPMTSTLAIASTKIPTRISITHSYPWGGHI